MTINPKYAERGARLKKARQTAGISQGELSEATGITQSNISRFERGMYDIPCEVVVYLHDFHHINQDFILFNRYPVSLRERLKLKQVK